MNKFLYSILIAAAGFGTLNAQQKVMKIEYKDGTTEMKNVTDVSKISFVSEGQVDPSEKMVDLGLSVKWASYNVGAVNPWEGGNFYAYGEIEPKQNTRLKTINGIATTTAKITTNGKSTTNWAQQSPAQTTTWHT